MEAVFRWIRKEAEKDRLPKEAFSQGSFRRHAFSQRPFEKFFEVVRAGMGAAQAAADAPQDFSESVAWADERDPVGLQLAFQPEMT